MVRKTRNSGQSRPGILLAASSPELSLLCDCAQFTLLVLNIFLIDVKSSRIFYVISDTQPVLVLRFEATMKDKLNEYRTFVEGVSVRRAVKSSCPRSAAIRMLVSINAHMRIGEGLGTDCLLLQQHPKMQHQV